MKKYITISREYGSGGHTIGSIVAKELGIPFYDNEIIDLAAKDSGLHPYKAEKELSLSRQSKRRNTANRQNLP